MCIPELSVLGLEVFERVFVNHCVILHCGLCRVVVEVELVESELNVVYCCGRII